MDEHPVTVEVKTEPGKIHLRQGLGLGFDAKAQHQGHFRCRVQKIVFIRGFENRLADCHREQFHRITGPEPAHLSLSRLGI